MINKIRLCTIEKGRFPKIVREGHIDEKQYTVMRVRSGRSLEDQINAEQFSFDLPTIIELG